MATPFMNLNLPIPSTTLGPAWASQLNVAIEAIDDHDHTNTKGRQIPTLGLNINADLTFNSYSVFNLKSTKFATQLSLLSGSGNAQSLWSYNGDLYYTNSAGTAVPITSGAALDAVPSVVTALDFDVLASDLIPVPVSTTDPVVYKVDTTALRTIELSPAASTTPGRVLIIKDGTGQAETNPITIVRGGGLVGGDAEGIDGQISITLNSNYGSVMLVCDGALGWSIV